MKKDKTTNPRQGQGLSSLGAMVYSTNPDFVLDTDGEVEEETLPKNRQRLRIRMEKNGRGGKVVTIVSGFTGSEADLKELGRWLKGRLGVGGSVKEGEVIIQGDFKPRVIELLKSDGYTDCK